jgi:hypothetical protein
MFLGISVDGSLEPIFVSLVDGGFAIPVLREPIFVAALMCGLVDSWELGFSFPPSRPAE